MGSLSRFYSFSIVPYFCSNEMNWLDALLLLPLLIGLIRGLMRGLITELIAILAVVIGVVGARLWGARFSAWLLLQTEWPAGVCDVIAYALLFLGIAIVLNILGRLLSKLLRAIHLGFLNRLGGGLFGIAKWALVVLIVVFLADRIDRQFGCFGKTEIVKFSVLYHPFVDASNHLLNVVTEATTNNLPN